ncbi:hypothetical protein HMPREF1395_00209 [Helicobacter pylori GAM112Ai]|nr:hypothetical protein HMPREF1395_00209 [Helicobacter pylori GAM112Ai]EMH33017.1 hypothetical protein HMPREF1424_00789 [Helicobacter pylori GAM42Ai]
MVESFSFYPLPVSKIFVSFYLFIIFELIFFNKGFFYEYIQACY